MDFPAFQKFIQHIPTLLQEKGSEAYGDPQLLQNILIIEFFFILSSILGLFLYHRIVRRRIKNTKSIQNEIKKRLTFLVEKQKNLALIT